MDVVIEDGFTDLVVCKPVHRRAVELDAQPRRARDGEQAVRHVERRDEHVLLLARRKAAEVAARLADDIPGFDGIVIGGDSMFELEGEVLGKPHTAANAAARWRAMRGRTGVLHSGHAVVRLSPGSAPREADAVAAASVTFADDVTDAEIDVYVASGEPLHVAGAFTIDSLGGAFIERIDGDPSTVVGMSVSTLRRLIRDLGVEWTDLWHTDDPSLGGAEFDDPGLS